MKFRKIFEADQKLSNDEVYRNENWVVSVPMDYNSAKNFVGGEETPDWDIIKDNDEFEDNSKFLKLVFFKSLKSDIKEQWKYYSIAINKYNNKIILGFDFENNKNTLGYGRGESPYIFLKGNNLLDWFQDYFKLKVSPSIVPYMINVADQNIKDYLYKQIQVMIENGADLNEKDRYGYTPLHWAIYNDDFKIVKLLLENKANINIQDEFGNSASHWGADNDNYDIMLLLIKGGVDVNIKNDSSETALFYSIKNNNYAICKLLLDSGGDKEINARNKKGETLIFWAIKNNNKYIMDLLIDYGADKSLYVLDFRENTLLYWSVKNDNLEITEKLLKMKININKPNNIGYVPLVWAVKNNNIEMIRLLLKYGAAKTINLRNDVGLTALHWAVRNNNINIVKLLLDNGAIQSIKVMNEKGESPFLISRKKGYSDIFHLFLYYLK